MSDIRSALTANIDEKLKVGPEIFDESKESDMEPFENESDNDTKMGTQNVVDAAKKKKFQQIRNVVNGFRSNRKTCNDEKPAMMSESNMNVSKSEKPPNFVRNTSSNSTIGRMWNSLFPNKEKSDSMPYELTANEENGSHLKTRSAKTLGRLFGHRAMTTPSMGNTRQHPPTMSGSDDETNEHGRKSNTLGRRISEGLRNFKNLSNISGSQHHHDVAAKSSRTPDDAISNQPAPIAATQSQSKGFPVPT